MKCPLSSRLRYIDIMRLGYGIAILGRPKWGHTHYDLGFCHIRRYLGCEFLFKRVYQGNLALVGQASDIGQLHAWLSHGGAWTNKATPSVKESLRPCLPLWDICRLPLENPQTTGQPPPALKSRRHTSMLGIYQPPHVGEKRLSPKVIILGFLDPARLPQ